jgi:hypothetical protein
MRSMTDEGLRDIANKIASPVETKQALVAPQV